MTMDPVVHFEIPASKEERAIKFYKKVFGWDIQEYQKGYSIAMTSESGRGGRPRQAGMINGAIYKGKKRDSPVIVIGVSSVRRYLKKVSNSGGQVITDPMEVEGMGIYAKIRDTEGNVMGLWEPIR
jgi:uncharacterized protein